MTIKNPPEGPSTTSTAIVSRTAAPLGSQVPPAVAYLAGYSGDALRAMSGSLRVVCDLFAEACGAAPGSFDPTSLPWGALERAHVKRIRELLAERYKPATAKRHFSALRGVLIECGNAAAVGVKGPKGSSEEKGRALTREELDTLLDVALDDYSVFRGAELRAMIAVGYAAGLRRAEIAALDTGDLVDGVIVVRKGKGRKARAVKLAPRPRVLVEEWLRRRGGEPGPMFYGRSSGAERRRISASAVNARLHTLAQRAEVAEFSTHDLRRTFVTRILELTGDLRVAQRLAGHASSKTTERYDKRGQEALDAASVMID